MIHCCRPSLYLWWFAKDDNQKYVLEIPTMDYEKTYTVEDKLVAIRRFIKLVKELPW